MRILFSVALLSLSLIGALANNDSCASSLTCYDCASQSQCSWCPTNSTCNTVDSDADAACSAQRILSEESCPNADPCWGQHSCYECLAFNSSCGWCPATARCTSDAGASCPVNMSYYQGSVDNCPDCPSLSANSCDGCASVTSCSWCPTTQRCNFMDGPNDKICPDSKQSAGECGISDYCPYLTSCLLCLKTSYSKYGCGWCHSVGSCMKMANATGCPDPMFHLDVPTCPDTCSVSTTCGACAASGPDCAFCAADSKCHNVNYPTCGSDPLWFSAQCQTCGSYSCPSPYLAKPSAGNITCATMTCAQSECCYDPCNVYSNCSACADQSLCAWCPTTNTCNAMNSTADNSCATSILSWPDCPGNDFCTRLGSCSSCLDPAYASFNCGWCEASGACVTKVNATNATCAGFFNGTQATCPDPCVASSSGCAVCAAIRECAWCPTSQRCNLIGGPGDLNCSVYSKQSYDECGVTDFCPYLPSCYGCLDPKNGEYSCGWCEATAQCLNAQTNNCSTTTMPVKGALTSCPDTTCAAATTCGACAALSTCAWCPSDGKCRSFDYPCNESTWLWRACTTCLNYQCPYSNARVLNSDTKTCSGLTCLQSECCEFTNQATIFYTTFAAGTALLQLNFGIGSEQIWVVDQSFTPTISAGAVDFPAGSFYNDVVQGKTVVQLTAAQKKASYTYDVKVVFQIRNKQTGQVALMSGAAKGTINNALLIAPANVTSIQANFLGSEDGNLAAALSMDPSKNALAKPDWLVVTLTLPTKINVLSTSISTKMATTGVVTMIQNATINATNIRHREIFDSASGRTSTKTYTVMFVPGDMALPGRATLYITLTYLVQTSTAATKWIPQVAAGTVSQTSDGVLQYQVDYTVTSDTASSVAVLRKSTGPIKLGGSAVRPEIRWNLALSVGLVFMGLFAL